MSNFTYEQVACPHTYFPNNPSRVATRIVMKTSDGNIAGWADYFIEEGWSKFPLFSVEEQHRNEATILAFISQVYQIVTEPKKTFWWAATPPMEQYFDQIASARPDLTFAAGGAINKITHAAQ